jgi:flagellum-specific ATP synthase
LSVLTPHIKAMEQYQPRCLSGRVDSVRGMTVRVLDFAMPIGGLIKIEPRTGFGPPVLGEVIGCDDRGTVIMLFSATRGLSPGDRVIGLQTAQTVPLGPSMLGRVLDGLGRPIDGGPLILDTVGCPISPCPTSALRRATIDTPLSTGIRSIDGFLTVGRGQRMGIFAGPGVGKSTILGSIARNADTEANVIALVGERGREVRDFVESTLGPNGLARSVVFVATGDESPLLRIRAALAACAAAEFLRDQGIDVFLMMDSITRFCQALRQVGLAAGEPPATKGYTPSVFAGLSLLLERAGNIENSGSITGFYTVLVEGDDMTEPISDAARSILDGHIALSRDLANRGHYPAVDVLDSVSRVSREVSSPQHNQARTAVLRLIAQYAEIAELVNIGAYVPGSNPEYDLAIECKPAIDKFLKQEPQDKVSFNDATSALIGLAVEAGHKLAGNSASQQHQHTSASGQAA